MRTAEHAPRDPFRVLERRHGLAEIVRMRALYAQALVKAQGADLDESEALNDLREAMTTLEDLARISRRVLGSAHPLVVDIESDLPVARAKLHEASA